LAASSESAIAPRSNRRWRKRTAITVTAAFLSVNGYKLEFDDAAAFQFMIELYESSTFRFAKLEDWLRQHARLAGSPGHGHPSLR
jgi:hypothetical protein